jgi:hypothetical protein
MKTTIIVMLLILCGQVMSDFYFDDGGTYDISWEMEDTWEMNNIYIDGGTTVNLLEGGMMQNVVIKEGYIGRSPCGSILNLMGGTVGDVQFTQGGSILSKSLKDALCVIHSGSFKDIQVYHGSLYIEGGAQRLYGKIILGNYGYVYISGGQLTEGFSIVVPSTQNGLVFFGNNFAIDGRPIGYGVYSYVDLLGGTQLTGTLLDGNQLDIKLEFNSISQQITLTDSLENLPPVCANRPTADINYDCVVDMLDMALLARQWLSDGWAD